MSPKFLFRVLRHGALALVVLALSSCSIQDPLLSPSAPSARQDPTTLGEALVHAAVENNVAEVERLIFLGADTKYKDSAGRPVLVSATRSNSVESVGLLLQAGADPNAQDSQQDSAFLYAGAEGLNEILTLTVEYGADVASTNRYGGTALIPAAEHGYVRTIRILLGTPIDPNHVNNLGWTALLEAVILGSGGTEHQEVVKLLIAAGADVNLADAQGVSPLAHTQQKQQSAVAKLLEEAGARR